VSRQLIAAPLSMGQAKVMLPALAGALSGAGPALAPYDSAAGAPRTLPDEVPDEVSLVVQTSGSAGSPHAVMLTAAALRASVAATQARLGDAGRGQWLLALPPAHIAGLQVLVRSLMGGTVPALMDTTGGFRPAAFAAAVSGMDPGRRCTSLVPTQLVRLLDDPVGLAALCSLDAVLLGGAGTPHVLLSRARKAGVSLVTTYGMSETCGGCVYDGIPLEGVHVRLDDDGRILLAGPMLATGYLGRPDLDAEAFVTYDGVRWLRTPDVGDLTGDGLGRLRVLGRADDIIITGGVKVSPGAVERILASVRGVAEVCVVGVPDDEWGQAVTAVVVVRGGATAPRLSALRSPVTQLLGGPAAPRHVVVVDELPVRGPGKVDRRATTALAARRLSAPALLPH
jgi:O-succinylbenzoic acid--CoA ligase